MELFDDFVPKPDSPLYLKINGHLKFFEKNGLVHVFYGYLPLVRFNPNDWVEKRLAAVRLADEFEIEYQYVARICGVHRDTVSQWVKTKRLLGIRYLLDKDRGPKAPWKLVDDIVRQIDQLVTEQPDIKNNQIVNILNKSGFDISETSVRRIRNRTQRPSLKQELASPPTTLDQMARIARRIEKYDLPQRQLQIFAEQFGPAINDPDPYDYQAHYQRVTASETAYLELLRAGQRCNYVGGLLYSSMLSQLQFNEIIEATYAEFYDKQKLGYPLTTIFQALFYMLFFHFPSIESLKKANRTDYGILIGQRQLPVPKVIHRALNQLTRFNRSSKLMKEFACQLVNNNLIEVGLLYFDEHFLPYYGIEHIPAGFFSQRRLAIGGNHQFWAHDRNGHPFFVITTSARLKLREMIPNMIRRAQQITGQKKLIIVFDRGGYDIKLFETVNHYKTVTFITWAKYISEKTLNQIPVNEYQDFLVTIDKEQVKYKLYDTTRTIKEGRTKSNQGRKLKTLTVRMIVLWRLSTDKKTALYTNDFQSPIEQLAEPMIRRWGAQENIFQKMMRRYNLNYHPGYYLEELINQPLVNNPDIKKIKKSIKELELSIIKDKSNLATRLLNLKRVNISVEKYRKRQAKSLSIIKDKQKQLDNLKLELETVPAKISILEVLAGKKMSQFDLEKKKIYDVIQIVAYNSEQMLLELFKQHYHNKRDIEQILDKIINHGGSIKLYNGKLYVLLDSIATPRYRRAAVGLCQEINQMQPRTNDRFRFPIFITVRKSD
jgi:transposase